MAQKVARLLGVVAVHRGAVTERVEVRQPQLAPLDVARNERAVARRRPAGRARRCSNSSGNVGRPSGRRGHAPARGRARAGRCAGPSGRPSACRTRTTLAASAPACAPCAQAASAPSSAAAATSPCSPRSSARPARRRDRPGSRSGSSPRSRSPQLEVLPPQPEQLALAAADDAREPEQRRPRLRRRPRASARARRRRRSAARASRSPSAARSSPAAANGFSPRHEQCRRANLNTRFAALTDARRSSTPPAPLRAARAPAAQHR